MWKREREWGGGVWNTWLRVNVMLYLSGSAIWLWWGLGCGHGVGPERGNDALEGEAGNGALGEVVTLSHLEWRQAEGGEDDCWPGVEVFQGFTDHIINKQARRKNSKVAHRGKTHLSNYLNNSIKNPSYGFLGRGDFVCISLNEFTWQLTISTPPPSFFLSE